MLSFLLQASQDPVFVLVLNVCLEVLFKCCGNMLPVMFLGCKFV